jgi:hypothetical protein
MIVHMTTPTHTHTHTHTYIYIERERRKPIKHPVATPLKVLIILTMGIIAMKHIYTATLFAKKKYIEIVAL